MPAPYRTMVSSAPARLSLARSVLLARPVLLARLSLLARRSLLTSLSLLASLSLVAGCAPSGPRPPRLSVANTSAIVVAELDFGRQVRDDGQNAAFRETASDTAVMFAPYPVNAPSWLKGRDDNGNALSWQPHDLYMSCDGRTGASTGAWQRPDGSFGYYTNIWQQLDKSTLKKPQWRWHLHHIAPLAQPRTGDDFINSRVASCDNKPEMRQIRSTLVPPIVTTGITAPLQAKQASADGSFTWSYQAEANGARTVSIMLWNGSDYDTVLSDIVTAENADGALK